MLSSPLFRPVALCCHHDQGVGNDGIALAPDDERIDVELREAVPVHFRKLRDSASGGRYGVNERVRAFRLADDTKGFDSTADMFFADRQQQGRVVTKSLGPGPAAPDH